MNSVIWIFWWKSLNFMLNIFIKIVHWNSWIALSNIIHATLVWSRTVTSNYSFRCACLSGDHPRCCHSCQYTASLLKTDFRSLPGIHQQSKLKLWLQFLHPTETNWQCKFCIVSCLTTLVATSIFSTVLFARDFDK